MTDLAERVSRLEAALAAIDKELAEIRDQFRAPEDPLRERFLRFMRRGAVAVTDEIEA